MATDHLDPQTQYEALLVTTKTTVLAYLDLLEDPSTLTGEAFELIVYQQLCKNAEGTIFKDQIVHTTDRAFPDIIIDQTRGIEVKATKGNSWASLGNSICEGSRVKTVENIDVFFGKLGGGPDIIIKQYESCLKYVARTHKPRYIIDMQIEEGQTFYDLMGTSYETIRNSPDLEVKVLAYLQRNSANPSELVPLVKAWSTLEPETSQLIKTDLLTRFPTILTAPGQQNDEIAIYLVKTYGVVTPNLEQLLHEWNAVT